MVKLGIPTLFLFSIFFVALPFTLSQLPTTRPLCASQFALVNYACARVPLETLSPPSPPPPPPEGQTHEHRQGHGNGHRHRHRHGHGHGKHKHHETTDQENCCRWLRQVDLECVCEVLVHLPPFLSRPNHEYTVFVDEHCSFTYSCGGRLMKP